MSTANSSPPSRRQITGAKVAPQPPAHLGEHGVADVVPPHVVDVLEAVQVQPEQHARHPFLRAAVQGPQQAATVGQPGERVGVRELPEVRLPVGQPAGVGPHVVQGEVLPGDQGEPLDAAGRDGQPVEPAVLQEVVHRRGGHGAHRHEGVLAVATDHVDGELARRIDPVRRHRRDQQPDGQDHRAGQRQAGPAWQSATPSPPTDAAVIPVPSTARQRRAGRPEHHDRGEAGAQRHADRGEQDRRAGGRVASPSSRVGSENSTQPTNQSAAPTITPSSASRAAEGTDPVTPGRRSRPKQNSRPPVAVPSAPGWPRAAMLLLVRPVLARGHRDRRTDQHGHRRERAADGQHHVPDDAARPGAGRRRRAARRPSGR